MAMGYSETRNSLDVDSMLLPWITLIDLFFFEIIYLSIRWRARRTSKDIDIYIDGDDCVSVRTINQVVCFLVTSLLTMRIDFSIDNLICPFSRPFFPLSLLATFLSLSLVALFLYPSYFIGLVVQVFPFVALTSIERLCK